MEKTKEMLCRSAIVNTLAYRSIFKYSLSLYQLRTTLITDQEFEDDLFKKELDYLIKKGEVKSKRQRYYAPGFRPVSWEQRAKQSKKLIDGALPAFKTLSLIPWIRLVGITGSVAAFSADQKSDIDVFIICTKNRTWLTRFFTVLMLKSLGKYRTDKESSGKICPNIYIDEDHITWPKEKRNLYVAQEIMMMHPVISKNEMYFRFVNSNKWIYKYAANFKVEGGTETAIKQKSQSKTVGIIENSIRSFQLAYMKKHRTTEITEKGIIHFNREDWTQKILSKYSKLTKTPSTKKSS
jgi:hypothetical protein